MKNMKIILSAIAVACVSPVAFAQAEPAEMAQGDATMVTAHVKGMVCDFCARSVSKVFNKHDAVEKVHVDLDSGEIHVGLKPGASLSDEEVKTMVEKSGYSLTSVERETL